MKNLTAGQQVELFKQCLDTINDGILITDCQQEDDPIIYANKGFLKMTGYNEQEVLGRNCRFLQGKDTDPETLKQLAIAIQKREAITVKMLNYRKDGSSFWNHFSIYPVHNERGECTHCIALEAPLEN